MKQQTLAATGFEKYRKPTRREAFLADMNQVLPWSALVSLVEPHYPNGENGRPPVGIERMLRIYFLQHWFQTSGTEPNSFSRISFFRDRFLHAHLASP